MVSVCSVGQGAATLVSWHPRTEAPGASVVGLQPAKLVQLVAAGASEVLAPVAPQPLNSTLI